MMKVRLYKIILAILGPGLFTIGMEIKYYPINLILVSIGIILIVILWIK